MIIIIGNEEKYRSKIIDKKYSEMDIMPSILSLFGINYENKFSCPFIKELNGEIKCDNNILLIQPFSDKYLNIISPAEIKYQYGGGTESITLYDLNNDPEEKNGRLITGDKKNTLNTIKELTK